MKASYNVKKAIKGNEWVCAFKIDGHFNFDHRGTDGTGVKLYATKEKAIAAGERYLKAMKKNGFEV